MVFSVVALLLKDSTRLRASRDPRVALVTQTYQRYPDPATLCTKPQDTGFLMSFHTPLALNATSKLESKVFLYWTRDAIKEVKLVFHRANAEMTFVDFARLERSIVRRDLRARYGS